LASDTAVLCGSSLALCGGAVHFTRELARRYGNEHIIAHALNPGAVRADFVSILFIYSKNTFVFFYIIHELIFPFFSNI
jgi:NAD(P)-dependent dehydrogenase (short-subunit alcohol dehydrogenase family)